jgi:ABC-type antimicrobial peptide transport system permease subunit
MLRNYFKTAWRILIRNKTFSLVNVLGLALGFASSLLIFLWISHERNIDNFHAAAANLYQVYERNYYDGKIDTGYPTQGLLADELKKVIPEVQFASGYEHASAPGTQSTFEAGKKILKMDGAFAGEDFFKMFSYPLLQGTPQTTLSTNESLAISRRMAEQFFGSASAAIGKTMRYENKEDLLVTAVFENVPNNSSLQFDFLRSWVAYVKQNDWVHNWGNTSPLTFLQLRSDANPKRVEAKVKDFIYRYQPKDKSFVVELGLQPYAERYLHSTFREGKPDGGRIEYVHLFTLVAVFILLIACINFMNLATARSTIRAKEVGVRKVIGANGSSLVRQFIGEAMLLCFLSALVALALTAICLPAFNSLTGKQLSLPLSQPVFWIVLVLLIVVTGLVAGTYPALFLSSLNPVTVLKTGLRFGRGAVLFRRGLVVFQFALSVTLIVGMIVIYRQMDYVQSKNLGYDRDNLLYIPIEGDLINNYNVFKQEATKIPGVLNVSKMRNSPTVIEHHTASIDWEVKDPNLSVSFADAVVGYDFAKTMRLKLKEGRDFSAAYGRDSASFLLNETAVAKIGYQNPVGKSITWGNHKGVIIGVLQDFHFNSMHQAIDPLIVRLDENWGWGTILIRIKGEQTKAVIAKLQNLCNALNPKFPFSYSFSDEEYARLYKSEETVSKLSNWAAFLGVFISCLGLFGLAMFTANQRTKEIGVRKVLGASAYDIAALLVANFLKPVMIAILIAIPLARYFMQNWLKGFAYRIEMQWWMFGLAGLLAIVIAMITVGFQAIKAAIANPVKSLRTE